MAARRKPHAPRPDEGNANEKLVLENVRCFARAEVPLDARVTVVIGRNGAGKTTIVEALASLVQGDHEGLQMFPLRQGARSGSIRLVANGDEDPARWDHSPDGDVRRRSDRRIFVYGQFRALRPPPRPRSTGAAIRGELGDAMDEIASRPPPVRLDDVERRRLTQTLFDFDEHLFRDLAVLAALLHDEGASLPAARAVWSGVRDWIRGVDRTVEDILVEEHGGRRVAVFQRAGVTLPLSELSDGYRAMLAVVLDLAVRYLLLFAGLDDPRHGEALVAIDEVDLNLHPRWQRQVIEQLTRLFPRTRFLLTTHSPTIVQAAIDRANAGENDAILVLGDNAAKGTAVHPLQKDALEKLDGAEVDSVLVEVFGMPSHYSPTYEKIEDRAASLRKKVEEGAATPAERKELLGLLDELQGLMARSDGLKRSGPLMSEIARTQVGLLRILDGQLDRKEVKAREKTPAKRRTRAR